MHSETKETLRMIADDAAAVGDVDSLLRMAAYLLFRGYAARDREAGRIHDAIRYEDAAEKELASC